MIFMGAITADHFRAWISYNPETGDFTWIKSKQSIAQGSPAGRKITRNGYAEIFFEGRSYLAHRLAVLHETGGWPGDDVDHINGCKTDNRWSNLRIVSRGENLKNQKMRKSNKSGVTGVCWKRGGWEAKIGVDGEQKYLGWFKELADAISARKAAEAKYGFHINHGRSH